MRDCGRFEEALWEAAEEGRPSPRLAAHLEQCASCRRALQEVSAAVGDLVGLRAVRAPDPRPALRARMAASPRGGRLAVALAVAAACLVAALALRVGWQVRRPEPAPHVVAGHGPDKGAPVDAIIAPSEGPAVVRIASANHMQKGPRPHRAVEARRPVRPALQTVHDEAKDTGGSPTQPPRSERPAAPSVDEPCPQVTVLYPRRPEPAHPQFVTADPTYRALPQPVRLVAVKDETPESRRPIL